jgi:uncharacterized protein YutE (UPF0331/DUF86 family)
VGLRNILIHAYSGIDLDIIWDIIKNRLSDLETKTRQVLKEKKIMDNGECYQLPEETSRFILVLRQHLP